MDIAYFQAQDGTSATFRLHLRGAWARAGGEGVPGGLQADAETAEIIFPQELQEETNSEQQTTQTSPGQSQTEGRKSTE